MFCDVFLSRLSQGRIYSKPGPVQKKMWSPRTPNTIIGLLLPHTVPSITQTFYLIYYFNDFRAISVCWHVAEIFLVLMWGPHFCGGPCSAMPKSASGLSYWSFRRLGPPPVVLMIDVKPYSLDVLTLQSMCVRRSSTWRQATGYCLLTSHRKTTLMTSPIHAGYFCIAITCNLTLSFCGKGDISTCSEIVWPLSQ